MVPLSDSSRRPTEFPAVTVARKHRSVDALAKQHPTPRYDAGAIATVSAVLVYFVATTIEITVIEQVRPGEMQLTWISDAVLAVAFGFAVFLWLHLKWTRMTLSRTVVAFAVDARAAGFPSMVSS